MHTHASPPIPPEVLPCSDAQCSPSSCWPVWSTVDVVPAASAGAATTSSSRGPPALHLGRTGSGSSPSPRSTSGKTRYVEGGASPKRGFDCSGYIQWVYCARAHREVPAQRRGPAPPRGAGTTSRAGRPVPATSCSTCPAARPTTSPSTPGTACSTRPRRRATASATSRCGRPTSVTASFAALSQARARDRLLVEAAGAVGRADQRPAHARRRSRSPRPPRAARRTRPASPSARPGGAWATAAGTA